MADIPIITPAQKDPSVYLEKISDILGDIDGGLNKTLFNTKPSQTQKSSDLLGDQIGKHITGSSKEVASVFKRGTDNLNTVMGAISKSISKIEPPQNDVQKTASNQGVFEKIAKSIDSGLGLLNKTIGVVLTPISMVENTINTGFSFLGNTFSKGVKFIGDIPGNIINGFGVLKEKIGETTLKVIDKLQTSFLTGIKTPLNLLLDPIKELTGFDPFEKISGVFSGLLDKVTGKTKKRLNPTKNDVSETADGQAAIWTENQKEKRDKKADDESKKLFGFFPVGSILKALPLAGAVAALAGGLIWAAVDGIRGFFKSGEWGVGKASGTIGAILGGMGSGLVNAFANAGKWALMGAGTGFLVGGPIGALVGGILGAVFGGIMGYFGGEKIAQWIDGLWKKITGKEDEELQELNKQKDKADEIINEKGAKERGALEDTKDSMLQLIEDQRAQKQLEKEMLKQQKAEEKAKSGGGFFGKLFGSKKKESGESDPIMSSQSSEAERVTEEIQRVNKEALDLQKKQLEKLEEISKKDNANNTVVQTNINGNTFDANQYRDSLKYKKK